MRLATFKHAGQVRVGALAGDHLVDVNRVYGLLLAKRGETRSEQLAEAWAPASMVEFLTAGERSLVAAREALAFVADLRGDILSLEQDGFVVPAAQAQILPPITNPPKIICMGRNYKEHVAEGGRDLPTIPILFTRFPSTLVAAGRPILRPRVSDKLDWEGELAVIIGKRGKHVSRAQALDIVAGYSIFNDISVRDYQQRVVQWTAGKNFDGSGPFGPYIVLKDEVPDPHNLELRTLVNGQVVQQANTGQMIFDIPTQIAHISEFATLEPGDVIITGTPSGVGLFRTPPWYLKAGDVVRVEISGLGYLENPVVDETGED